MRLMSNSPLRKGDVYISFGLLFAVVSGFFFFAGNYILYFQETQSLFLLTGGYFVEHLSKPGALLEYAAKFLTQFYVLKFAGSFLLSVIIVLPGVLMYGINKRLSRGEPLTLILLLLPSLLLLLLQSNYYHMMENNLGFLVVLGCYLLFIKTGKKYRHRVVLILFPLLYFLAGAYIMIFVAMYSVHNLVFETGWRKYGYSLMLLAIAVLTYFIFLKFIFLQPFEQLLLFPLPVLDNKTYRLTYIALSAFIIFYPLLSKFIASENINRYNKRIYGLTATFALSGLTIFLLFKDFNPQSARVVELQRLVFNQKWNKAIKYQEKYPSRNLIGQYFYNIALSETDQLCDRLFYGSQDFGTGSLVLPWGDEHLNRGAYFYYTIGLVNEAQRWAYEEMVVYGYRPQNLELLVKTCLINGDFTMARKYLGILKNTLFYRKHANEFEELADNPDLIAVHPELGPKLKLVPKANFFIQFAEPQNNLSLILASQPDNRKAFGYYMAWLLLSKDVEGVVNSIRDLKALGYTRIPVHLEEAVWIYYNSTGVMPDLGGLSLSQESAARFEKYFASYVSNRQNTALLKQRMAKDFSNTFWYYFHFK